MTDRDGRVPVKIRRVDLYIEDFLGGCSGEMRPDEFGIYWMICLLMYSRGDSIPNDPEWIASRFKRSTDIRVVKRCIRELVACGKVVASGAELTVNRVASTLEVTRNRVATNRENGNKGGRPSKQNNGLENPHGSVTETLPPPVPPPPPPPSNGTVNTDTESLIDKSLPLAANVGKKINGFHNGSNGSTLKQQKADQFVQQQCAEALGKDGWMIVFAAEDEKSPEHSKAVSLMLKTSKRLKLGWISPEEKRRRAARV